MWSSPSWVGLAVSAAHPSGERNGEVEQWTGFDWICGRFRQVCGPNRLDLRAAGVPGQAAHRRISPCSACPAGPALDNRQVNACIIAGVSLEATAMDLVFKALADPTRRLLLDRLREHNGQTLREMCERLGMARQSATQHLDILVRSGLVTVVRRGRERLHYLNPAPIHEIEERWISGFDKPRLQAISAIKHQAEEYAMTNAPAPVPDYVYVTYIRASAQQVWQALTDADLTARYWGHANVSDWQPGSAWEHRRADGSGKVDVVGHVLKAEPRPGWSSPSKTPPISNRRDSRRSSPSSSNRIRTSSASP